METRRSNHCACLLPTHDRDRDHDHDDGGTRVLPSGLSGQMGEWEWLYTTLVIGHANHILNTLVTECDVEKASAEIMPLVT